ncbi:MAG TPA: hypothetical protein VK747_02440, partial [Blastocatellia bacterium]|nr:hypothetical protein [Blastocatellia bacterium]
MCIIQVEINGFRGVSLRPRRGGISDRYLEILAKEHIAFALVDCPEAPPMVYDLTKTGIPPQRLRALPVSFPSVYPNMDVIEA